MYYVDDNNSFESTCITNNENNTYTIRDGVLYTNDILFTEGNKIYAYFYIKSCIKIFCYRCRL